MRNLLTLLALFVFAALASANPPQARAVYCPPAAVYAPQAIRVQQYVQPVQVQRVYAAPLVQQVQDYCAPAQFVQPARVYYQPQAIVQQVYQPLQVQYGYSQALQVRQQAVFGGGVDVVRRQGLFERLGNAQAARRDAQALRQLRGPQAIVIR